MNVPNLLTLSRFAMIPIYLTVFAFNVQAAFLIVLLAGLTDILDGYIARKRGQITPVGVMLDPLADKSMMIVVMLSLLYKHLIGWEAAAAMLLRDAGMIVGSAFSHFRGKNTVPANWLGKVTTILYYSAILLVVFQLPFALGFLWGVIILSFITSAVYVWQFRVLNQNRSG